MSLLYRFWVSSVVFVYLWWCTDCWMLYTYWLYTYWLYTDLCCILICCILIDVLIDIVSWLLDEMYSLMWFTCWTCFCGYILSLMMIGDSDYVLLTCGSSVLKWISVVDFILWSWYSICTWFMYDDWLCGVGIGLSVLILWIILPSWVACVTLR